jgi:exopolysaccharide biosynthesis operon protein EpsL
MLSVGASLNYNSNVFQLADDVDPQARLGSPEKSDFYRSGYLGLRLDQPYLNQRFVVDATITANRYQTFEQLDFDATQYSAAWHWRLTPRFSGKISADQSESLVNYSDFRQFDIRNVRTNRSQELLGEYWVFGGWYVTGGLSSRQSKTEQPVTGEDNFRNERAEAGAKYRTLAGNTVHVTLRTHDGDYIDRTPDPVQFLGDGFEGGEAELGAAWALSGRSTLEGKLRRIDYRENGFPQRNFSGTAGSLDWRWALTGRVALTFAASRALFPYRDLSATYRVEDQYSARASWEFGPRTVLSASLLRGDSDYREPLVALPGPERRDRSFGGQLAAEWRVLRNGYLNASYSRQERSSNYAQFEYDGYVISLGGSLRF